MGTPSFPGNRLVAYIQSLAKNKKELPYGLPVCVAPSHTITNTEGLLRLASLLGPYIAILQVHADIIDDWSEDTIRQLTSLAKRHAFLIWESGRILNATIDVVGRQKVESREVRNELVDLIRKKYTKGVVKPASWAGISTAWASGVAVNNQEADILIPTLKAAAREAVADAVQTIRTEITADHPPSNNPFSSYGSPTKDANEDTTSQHLTFDYAIEENNSLGLPPRKASTISLTQTISQHTEDSGESMMEPETYEPRDYWGYAVATPPAIDTDLPPPPLLARGLVLCLPSVTDTSFTAEYRKSCIAAACANQDFVLGFLCGEPWHLVSQRDDIFDPESLKQSPEQQQVSPYSSDEDEAPACLALFSIISHRLNLINEQQLSDHGNEIRPSAPEPVTHLDYLNPLASKLYSIIGQAIKFREAFGRTRDIPPQLGTKSSSRQPKPDIIHIPVVSIP
ncbi:hypothetical protein P175DRAFT_0499416 [Aspergillus ochraceoroseus IBT 24754]|nr:uncharacterized protein P175DRAFT_0499416 [Aspergillus ochraceoroseus IBT 24754]PTU22876.1 hypothetical protein P175DRAFT_0499416 [Aspergillus ochraceoroseus IBT 24754]